MLSVKPLTVGAAGGLLESTANNLLQQFDSGVILTSPLTIMPQESSAPYSSRMEFLEPDLSIFGSIGKTFIGANTFNITANDSDIWLQNGNGDVLEVRSTGCFWNGSPIAVEVAPGLQTPTLQNAYNTTGSTNPVRYFKIGNWGFIQGNIRRSTPPAALSVMFNVPVGYRPNVGSSIVHLWLYNTLACQITEVGIAPNGNVSFGIGYALAGTPSGAGSTNVNLMYRIA